MCRRLDGLPLAIEPAAARLRSLSLDEIVERLAGRMDLPTRAGEGTPERHRTMRAAIDWSHDLLAPDERRILRRLAVFRDRLDAGAALAVWGDAEPDDDPFASLCRLVDQSMVVAEPSLEGPMSYRLLETVRQYAEERLAEAGEGKAARARHASWCAGLVAAARDWGGSRQEFWLARLGAAHNDLLAALVLVTRRRGRSRRGAGYGGGPVVVLVHGRPRGRRVVWLRRTLAASSPLASKTRAAALRPLARIP